MTTEERQQLSELLTKVANDLGEHFDAVQVMATICDNEGSSSFYRGSGNWFARQGLAHEFVTSEIAETAGRELAKQLDKE